MRRWHWSKPGVLALRYRQGVRYLGENATDRAWVDHARRYLNGVDSLGERVLVDGEAVEIRDIVVHLIEEYAQHLGHADLLRECIDGRTGL